MAKKEPKIGLALGSGGLKGLAHIGVIKALEKAGIKPDYIVGVSSGAIVGAYYALNGEVKSLEKKVLKLTPKEFRKFADITYPTKALFSGKTSRAFYKELFKDKKFSDTKTELIVIATALQGGKELRLNKGSIYDAVCASTCVPGIFPPYKLGKYWAVDGGVVNPTPVDVVKKLGADIIIGVNLTILPPSKIKEPNIVDTLLTSFEIFRFEEVRHASKGIKDIIMITPNFKSISASYTFKDVAGYIRRGREATEKKIPKIKKLVSELKEEN
mgnify:CR=1 FL=1